MAPKSATNSKRSDTSKKNISNVPIKPTINTSSASGMDPEIEDRFELELCWCIQQLEATLANGKLQEKQAHDITKHIYSLKSNAAPLIKKRQIMRNTLGDYRQKMAEDERKLNKTISAVKFTSTTTPNKKSLFLKKATQHTIQEKLGSDHKTENALVTNQTINDNNKTQTPFQFNFQRCQ